MLHEILDAGRDVLRITFITPIVEGRPRPSQWPLGLRPVGWFAATTFVLLVIATLASGPLRRYDVLVSSLSANQALPSLAIPLLLTALVAGLAMVLTAALHTTIWLRIALMSVGALAVLPFVATTAANPIQTTTSMVGLAALVIFITVRAFRSYAWWEFVVVLGLLMVSLLLTWVTPAALQAEGDLRPVVLESAFSNLMVFILPAVMVAGFAPAQIVVTGAQAIADRPVSRAMFWTVFGIALTGLITSLAFDIAGGSSPSLVTLLSSGIRLVLIAGLVRLLVYRARVHRPPSPAALPEAWIGWAYPVTAVMAGLILVTFVVFDTSLTLSTFSTGPITQAAMWLSTTIRELNTIAMLRAVLGPAILIAAWRLASRNRLTEAIMLGTFGVMAVLGALGTIPVLNLLRESSAESMGLIAAVTALAATVVHVIRRSLSRDRATGVLTVMSLTLLYPHRDFLSDPVTTTLAVAPAAMLVFGLAWRVFTEAQVTYDSSARYPQSTRVLLFLANSLLATTGIAFVILSRSLGTGADSSTWAGVGDIMLGEPLYVAGLVTALWLMLRPHDRGEVVEKLTAERYDSAEAQGEEAFAAALPGMTSNPGPNSEASNHGEPLPPFDNKDTH